MMDRYYFDGITNGPWEHVCDTFELKNRLNKIRSREDGERHMCVCVCV